MQLPFGTQAVFRKACFTGLYYTGNSIADAENTSVFFKEGKQHTRYRIIITPAWPLT